jgi:hypothetical protein
MPHSCYIDINPTYDRLDPDNPDAAIDFVIGYLTDWQLVPSRSPEEAGHEDHPGRIVS